MAGEMFVCAHQPDPALPGQPASWIKCVLETSTYLLLHKPLPLTCPPHHAYLRRLASRIYAIRMHANGWHKIIQFYILLAGLVESVRGGWGQRVRLNKKFTASFRHSLVATMSVCVSVGVEAGPARERTQHKPSARLIYEILQSKLMQIKYKSFPLVQGEKLSNCV